MPRWLDTLKRWAQTLKRDAITLYLAARDPRVPWYAKALAGIVAAYALSPIDLIPDFIPIVGYLDELILLPLAIAGVLRLIDPAVLAERRARATVIAERPVSKIAAVLIMALWLLTFALMVVGHWQRAAASGGRCPAIGHFAAAGAGLERDERHASADGVAVARSLRGMAQNGGLPAVLLERRVGLGKPIAQPNAEDLVSEVRLCGLFDFHHVRQALRSRRGRRRCRRCFPHARSCQGPYKDIRLATSISGLTPIPSRRR